MPNVKDGLVNHRKPVPVGEDVLAEIGARHGLRWDGVELLPSAGIINTVLGLGPHYVLRVPHDHPGHIAQALREAAAIPIAADAGVRTAALVVFDGSCELLPVPSLVVERLPGVDAESSLPRASDAPDLWREVGQDLARLHVASSDVPVGRLTEINEDFLFADPEALVDRRVQEGWMSPIEGRWLAAWLDRLAANGATPARSCLVHGDVQMSNVLVANGSYLALIDWGCARIDDPVADFLAVPMAAVPALLAGHREVAPLPNDDGAEARLLWRRLQMLLAVLGRGAAPGTTWGERPVAWLFDLLRFFADPPETGPWRRLGPPLTPRGKRRDH